MTVRYALTAALVSSLLLVGCATPMKPLDYHASQPYVPVTLALNQGGFVVRLEGLKQREVFKALMNTGAFSTLNTGFNRTGYTLMLASVDEKGDNYVWLANSVTVFTLPLPYPYKEGVRATLYKDGQAVKTYRYSREGVGISAWYAPSPNIEASRQMLDRLMVDLARDKVIPYQR